MRITQDYLKSRLKYDPLTGIFTWKPKHDSLLWSSRWSGKIAGTVSEKGNGYRRVVISIDGKFFFAHRLAWVYMTGTEPPKELDHVNRDATDNRWLNIRDSKGRNQKNKSMQRNNKSGATGVSWSKVSNKWAARVWVGEKGSRVYRHLGLFSDLDEAARVVAAFREGIYLEGHGERLAPYMREQMA